jgi:hypothetical protein
MDITRPLLSNASRNWIYIRVRELAAVAQEEKEYEED